MGLVKLVEQDALDALPGRAGEFGRLSGERLAAVVLGERGLHDAGFARRDADQLFLETGNELAGADHDLNALASAAVERRAVDAALEVDGDPVAALRLGAFGLADIAAVLVGDALDRLVDIGAVSY